MAALLGSWKEIASYLGKGVRTVQRWERMLGLPVHRPEGARHGVVLAFPAQLDTWAVRHLNGESGNGGRGLFVQSRRTAQASAQLVEQAARLHQLAGTLVMRCRELALGVERRNAAHSRTERTPRGELQDRTQERVSDSRAPSRGRNGKLAKQ